MSRLPTGLGEYTTDELVAEVNHRKKVTYIPIKIVLKLIALQAAGDTKEFQRIAVEMAEKLMKDDEELALYILAQYKLIPTWEPQG